MEELAKRKVRNSFKYRPEIDGLRAVAVVPVILFHAGFDFFGGGFVGVDVFFVISGYLITSVILSEIHAGTFTLAGFYERRARRILPALFFVVLVCLPFAWALLMPRDMKDFSQSIIAVVTFSSNILFWLESGYFDTAAELKPLLHTWSLSVEEQYYIIFPLFVVLSLRYGGHWVLFLLLVGFCLSLSLSQWGAYNYPSATFYLLHARGWEILLGALAAFFLFSGRWSWKNPPACQVISLTGLFLIGYSVFSFDERTPFPSFYAIAPTLGTALIILFAVEGTVANRILRTRWLVGIGLVSYSAYLWHQPLFAFCKYRMLANPPGALMAALCLLALLLAHLSWRYVEKPFRNRKSYSRAKVYSWCFGVGGGLFVFGLLGHNQDGYQTQRFTETQIGMISSAKSDALPRCENVIEACGNSAATSSDVLLLGDSHAHHFSGVLGEIVSQSGGRVLNVTKGGCLPLSPFDRDDMPSAFNDACAELSSNIRNLISINTSIPKTVVVSAAWSLYYYGPEYYESVAGTRVPLSSSELVVRSKGTSSTLSRDEILQRFDEYLYQFAQYLTTHFERVVFIAPLPPLVNDLKGHKLLEIPTGSDSADFFRENSELLRLFGKLGDLEGVGVFYPHRVLCDLDDIEKCLTFSDSKHLYADSTHVSEYGQRLVFLPFFRTLLQSR